MHSVKYDREQEEQEAARKPANAPLAIFTSCELIQNSGRDFTEVKEGSRSHGLRKRHRDKEWEDLKTTA